MAISSACNLSIYLDTYYQILDSFSTSREPDGGFELILNETKFRGILTKEKKRDSLKCVSGISCGEICIPKTSKCRIGGTNNQQSGGQLNSPTFGVISAKGIALGVSLGLIVIKSGVSFAKSQSVQNFYNKEQQELKNFPSVSEPRLDSIVKQEDDVIRQKGVEHGAIIDSRTGKVLARRTNNNFAAVKFEAVDLLRMKGNVVTHNHPSSDYSNPSIDYPRSDPRYKGVGFSPPDLAMAAVYQVGELRAVGRGYNYSIKPPPEGWNSVVYLTKIKPSYDRNYKRSLETARKAYEQKKMTEGEAEFYVMHEAMNLTAKETGIQYRKVAI